VFVEVTNFPDGISFFLGDTAFDTIVDGSLLVPAADLSSLQMQPPQDFSGNFTFDMQASLRDEVNLDASPPEFGNIRLLSDTLETFTIQVFPVADGANEEQVTVLEDQMELIQFGSSLVAQGLVLDDGSSFGNNNATETIYEITIEIPNATATFDLTIAGLFAGLVDINSTVLNDAVEVSYQEDLDGAKVFTLRSLLIPNGSATSDAELLALPLEDRVKAMSDIFDVLELLTFTLGPEHTDDDGTVSLTAFVADINTDVTVSEQISTTQTKWNPLLVKAIADLPVLMVVNPAATVIDEDSGVIPLSIGVTASADRDDSEVLIVDITVPFDSEGEIGEIVYIGGGLPPDVSFTRVGSRRWTIEADGATPEIREDLLNSILNAEEIAFLPRNGWADTLVDRTGIRVELISRERQGGDQAEVRQVTVEDFIGIEVIPVADEPTVETRGNAIGKEDVSNQLHSLAMLTMLYVLE
jgi:hypothetical protein